MKQATKRMGKRAGSGFLIGLLLSLMTLGYDVIAQEDPPRVDVAVQVTSGVVNPSFEFDDPNDLDTLRALIRGLPAAPEVDEPQFGSFLLSADEARCQFPERVVVFDGTIKATTADGTVRFFVDEKGLEQFLRDSAVAAGIDPPPP